MRLCTVLLAAAWFAAAPASAFEGDVHFGLTQWLAMQAGFTTEQAQAIATGDQRVDSGDMQFMELSSAYACAGKDVESSALIELHHFPSAKQVPAPPDQRVVIAGGDAAMKPSNEIIKLAAGKASFMLFKLGEAIHALQDSWAHQGISDIPQPLPGALSCDPTLAWSSPAARGGWNSHKADLTREWPADTLAMATATYDVLTRYPLISDAKRSPREWNEIRPLLDGFIRAGTKAEKRAWFVGRGIADVSFLEAVSLPDGAQPFDLKWEGRKLPPLASAQSAQHHVEPDLLDFFIRFFTQWVSSDNFDAIATEFGTGVAAAVPGARKAPHGRAAGKSADKAELVARLKIWRLRDHGSVLELAHSLQRLNARQLAMLNALSRKATAYAHYELPARAFFPILPKLNEASPMVPFLISPVPPSENGDARAVATVKFRHAPYDAIEVLAEKTGERWHIVTIASTVEH